MFSISMSKKRCQRENRRWRFSKRSALHVEGRIALMLCQVRKLLQNLVGVAYDLLDGVCVELFRLESMIRLHIPLFPKQDGDVGFLGNLVIARARFAVEDREGYVLDAML